MAGRGKGGKGLGRGRAPSEEEEEEVASEVPEAEEEEGSEAEADEASEAGEPEAKRVKEAEPEGDEQLQATLLKFFAANPDVVISKKSLMREVVTRDLDWFQTLRKRPENAGKADGSILNRNLHKLKTAGKLVLVAEKNPPVYKVSA